MAPVERSGMTLAFISVLGLALAFAAFSSGCEDTGKANASVAPVKIKGKTFFLEVADTDAVRTKGLGGRTSIDPDGGMIFVFPGREFTMTFVMRDCPIDIDVIFTDASGRVVKTHAMKAEKPRDETEGKPTDDPRTVPAAMKYENRLVQYSSKTPAAFAIELQAGMIEKLGVKETDKLEFQAAELKAKAR